MTTDTKPEGLSDEQFDHFQQLASLFEQIAERKYTKGALEHKSNLWQYSDEWLEAAEMEELIDLIMYRMTRLVKRRFATENGASDDSESSTKLTQGV